MTKSWGDEVTISSGWIKWIKMQIKIKDYWIMLWNVDYIV